MRELGRACGEQGGLRSPAPRRLSSEAPRPRSAMLMACSPPLSRSMAGTWSMSDSSMLKSTLTLRHSGLGRPDAHEEEAPEGKVLGNLGTLALEHVDLDRVLLVGHGRKSRLRLAGTGLFLRMSGYEGAPVDLDAVAPRHDVATLASPRRLARARGESAAQTAAP